MPPGIDMNVKDLTFYWSHGKFNVRVGVIVEHAGRVLLQAQGKKFNDFCLIGGRIQFGENSRDAIIREISEELNYTISDEDSLNLNFISENCFMWGKRRCHEMLFIYRLTLGDNSPLINRDDFACADNERYHERWVNCDAVADIKISPKFLDKYITHRDFEYINGFNRETYTRGDK